MPVCSKTILVYSCFNFTSGNWSGEAKFKMYFTKGGAIEFGQAMLRAGQLGKHTSYLLSDSSSDVAHFEFFLILRGQVM